MWKMGISSTLVTDADFFSLRKVTDADDIATDAHDNLLRLHRPTIIYMQCEINRLQPFTFTLQVHTTFRKKHPFTLTFRIKAPFHIHIQKKKAPNSSCWSEPEHHPTSIRSTNLCKWYTIITCIHGIQSAAKNAQKNLLANIQISEDASKSLQQSWTKINEQR